MNHEQEVCFHGDLDYKRSLTQRVCRSTLAAKAAHLADAVEASDWLAVLLAEALEGDVNLKDWIEIVNKHHRVSVTDARASTSTGRRTTPARQRTGAWRSKARCYARQCDGRTRACDGWTACRTLQTS